LKPSVENLVGEATERSVAEAKPAASLDIEGEPSRAVPVKAMEAVKILDVQAAKDSPA
jgi:hypothetical protein